MHLQIKKINNITTIFVPMLECNSTTFQVYAKAGSIYENTENNGISHFLEHIFFKGGKKYKTHKEILTAIDQIGGETNAFTSDEYAGYYIKTAPEHLGLSIDILADILVHPRFPQNEIEKEKGVIVQEIKMYEDMPHRMVIEKWREFYYGNNSYGRPTTGTIENVMKFQQKDFFEYKDSLYTQDNMVIIVAGNINDQNKIEDKIADSFKGLNKSSKLKAIDYPEQRNEQKIKFFDKKTEQNHLIIGAEGFSLQDKQKYAASLLGIILGGNMSSKLFVEIREKKGLCYYINAFHNAMEKGGFFMIRAGLDKERFEYGLEEIYKEIEKTAKGNISTEEFNKGQGFIKGKTQMGIETSDQMADFVGEQYLLQGNIKTLDEILKEYERLTLEDVLDVAKILEKSKLYSYYIC